MFCDLIFFMNLWKMYIEFNLMAKLWRAKRALKWLAFLMNLFISLISWSAKLWIFTSASDWKTFEHISHLNGWTFSYCFLLNSPLKPNFVVWGDWIGLFLSWTWDMCLLRVGFASKTLKHNDHLNFSFSLTFLDIFFSLLSLLGDQSWSSSYLDNLFWITSGFSSSWTLETCF